MKTKHSLSIVTVLLFCLYACKKDSNKTAPIGQTSAVTQISPVTQTSQFSLVGKWNIVRDTSYLGANTGANPVIYVGQPGDYFDFRANGNVYIKQGAVLDTLSYKLLSNNQIDIEWVQIKLSRIKKKIKFR